MSNVIPSSGDFKPKSFWQRPEGVTGALFMGGLLLGGGYLLFKNMAWLIAMTQSTITLAMLLVALGAIVYILLDPRFRNLVWYMYKSVMRWVTGMFVQIDPVGVLKSYIDHLSSNLSKMSTQIASLKGQIRNLATIMETNNAEIKQNLAMANKARELGQEGPMTLASRKAARLQDSNAKYDQLSKKMVMLEKILSKMYQNSEVLLEDTKDQVRVKEVERKAIRTSHSAMKNAMSVIGGDKDQRAMFDMAVEAIADDVSSKIGEMERFMDMSANFMSSVDLQNGVWEEEGLRMLEQYEKQSSLMLTKGADDPNKLELNSPPEAIEAPRNNNGEAEGYDSLFK
jgi:hypothetical protein